MYLIFLAITVVLSMRKIEGSSVVICGGDVGYIKCGSKQTIKVVQAMFGRTDELICPNKNTVTSRKCASSIANSAIRRVCNGYKVCRLEAIARRFRSACVPSIGSYLEVQYTCIPAPKTERTEPGRKIIAFTASMSKSRKDDRNHHPVNVVYDKIVTNEGNGYNNITGFFTAPVPGVYTFQWVSLVPPDRLYDTEIAVNAVRKLLCNCNNEKGTALATCTGSAMLKLKEKDHVNIRKLVGNFLIGGNWSSFSGWLLG